MGIPREALASAVYLGLSDPSKNSFKKFTAVEDDVYQVRFSADLQTNASIILRRRKDQ